MAQAPELLQPFKPIIIAEVAKGLDKAGLLPVGSGYLDFTGGASTQRGAFVRGEAGWHPRDALTIFGYGQASTSGGAEAGAGLRWTF